VDCTRRRVRQHFDGAEERRAASSLEVYLGDYTGGAFESLADADTCRLTANDFVAVSALSAAVPPKAAIRLLDTGMQHGISSLLRAIPDVSIWDAQADLSQTGAAWELWELLLAVGGVGPVRASKLMSSKRPALIPIEDQHVAASLAFGHLDYWALMQNVLQDRGLRERVSNVARDAGGAHLSVLRVIDIVVWMRQHGYASLKDPMRRVGYDAPLPPNPAWKLLINEPR